MAYIYDTNVASPSPLNSVQVIREFQDLIDLFGIPMDLDIYFDIDIEADAELIFIPLYKMTPIELKKLKKQFLDLLSKNFIRPSVFL